MTIHPVIKSIQEKHRDLIVLAYLDDIFVVGHAEQAMFLLSDLRSSLQQLGLQICDRKCELYGDSLPRGCTLNVSTTSEGIEVLGIPVGKKEYIQQICSQKAKEGNKLCSELRDLNDPQSSMLLLRHCHNPRMNFLARSVTPDNMKMPPEYMTK